MVDGQYAMYKHLSQQGINNAFVDACRKNELATIEYLLNSSEIPINAQINETDIYGSVGLCAAIASYNNEVVRFLVTSPKLKQKADIHIQNDTPFKFCLINNNKELIKLFVLEMNIEKTEFIINAICDFDDDDYAERLFAVRELNQELSKSLLMNKTKNKALKI